jgi:serine/threonine protein kinase
MTQELRIDGLRIGRLLGEGGMGAVFAARDASGQPVAVKTISARSLCDLARARFAVEVDALAHVCHPHVVHLRASGESSGIPYAILERIRGFGLDRIRGGIPWRGVVHLGRQLAGAIAALHQAGFIHRDIKPSNAMVGRDGHLTLIDLGVAKRTSAADHDGIASPSASPLTQPGVCMGTPRFLAPEVALGRPATERSDLYGLGVVLEHLLGPAFEDDVPDELRALIDQCLDDDPRRRPVSAEAIAATLDALPAQAPRFRRCVHCDVAVVPARDPEAATGPTRSVPASRRRCGSAGHPSQRVLRAAA